MPAAAARTADPDQHRTGADQASSTRAGFKSRTLSMLFPRSRGRRRACAQRLDELRREASQAIAEGVTILILSDRGVNAELVPIPGPAGHQRRASSPGARRKPHALRPGRRNRRSPRGASLRPADRLRRRRGQSVSGVRHAASRCWPKAIFPPTTRHEKLEKNYVKAVGKGLLKVMSKMGISTQQSYRGAQIFEAIGLNSEFVDEYFTCTASRIEGVGPRSDRRRIASPPRARLSRAPKCRRRSTSTSAGNISGVARAKPTSSTPT